MNCNVLLAVVHIVRRLEAGFLRWKWGLLGLASASVAVAEGVVQAPLESLDPTCLMGISIPLPTI